MKKLGTVAALVLLTAGCGDNGDGKTAASDRATGIKTSVSAVTKTVTLTEDSDPNELLGRPNGYEAATVLYDSRAECDELGVDCGATLETWPNADAAQERADYIDSLGAIANEYDYVDGPYVLRVTGELKPSEAAEYEAAFAG